MRSGQFQVFALGEYTTQMFVGVSAVVQ